MKRAQFSSCNGLPWLLVAPQVVVVSVFVYFPAFQSLISSFSLENAFGTSKKFVGFANFHEIFIDPSYLESLALTAVFVVGVTFLSQLGGLFFAHLLFYVRYFKAGLRSFALLPFALGAVPVGVIWKFLLAPNQGSLAAVLNLVGVNWDYTTNGVQALLLLIVAASWQRIAYCCLYYLAAYYALPAEILEASRLECGSYRRFFSFTWPLLRPTTFFLVVVNITYSFFETFPLIDVLTQGGPRRSTTFLLYRVYIEGQINLNLGAAAAQSALLMLLVIGLTRAQFNLFEREKIG